MKLELKRAYLYILPILFTIASIALFSSILFEKQIGNPTGLYQIFDISFYHFIPVFMWLIYLPLIYKLYNRFPLSFTDWKQNIKNHVLISLAFSPVSRLISITVDFFIKIQIGMLETSLLSLLMEVRWTIFASIPKALFTYWTILLILHYLRHVSEPKINDKLILESPSGTNIIPLEDILWIKAAGNYIVIRTRNGEIKSRKTFKALLAKLDENFMQIHRSTIVNQDAVSTLSHWRNGEYLITMKDGTHLSSTRTYLENVRQLSI